MLEMVSQRVYGLALGYEDLNDHEQLRQDPLFGVLAGREELDKPLAGKSTLNRLELGNGKPDRYKKITFWKQAIDELLVSVFLEAHAKAPEEDRSRHRHNGSAAAREAGRSLLSRLLRSLLLPAAVRLLRRTCSVRAAAAIQYRCFGRKPGGDRGIVEQIRSWPAVKIILRGDSGFCRDELMSWCESKRVDYVFGLARNQRLRRSLDARCGKPRSSGSRPASRRECLLSSSIRPEKRRTEAGIGNAAWWPKPSISTARRIRALW